ncbi:hypothetical protein SNL152K_5511 [Streptomyces sp. NL15-2K]|nr:hypothetical protein SNL152K_5511 [Streptomyces sp. NL15-2K]
MCDDDPAAPPADPSRTAHDSGSGSGRGRRDGKHIWFELRDHPAHGQGVSTPNIDFHGTK